MFNLISILDLVVIYMVMSLCGGPQTVGDAGA